MCKHNMHLTKILTTLQKNPDGIRIRDLAHQVNLSPSTTLIYLRQLQKQNKLTRHEMKRIRGEHGRLPVIYKLIPETQTCTVK